MILMLTQTSMSEDTLCLRFKTASDAATAEDILRGRGRSYRTKIVKTKKNGLEYIVVVLASSKPVNNPVQ